MQKRILCWFDYNSITGFSTVSKHIVSEIKKVSDSSFILDIVAVNYFGPDYMEDKFTLVTSAKLNDPQRDGFGRNWVIQRLNQIEYDGLFICQDLGVVTPIVNQLNAIKSDYKSQKNKCFKSIFYFPVDCKLIIQLTLELDFFDVIATYTDYGKNEILRLRPDLKYKLNVVPHGVDTSAFYPLSTEEIINFRREYFGANSNKFIVSNINRNQPRKDIPSTIFAFLEAKYTWPGHLPEPFLYLHCNPMDPAGWDIRVIMMQLDLIEGVDFQLLHSASDKFFVDIKTLNRIYNASDVCVTSTLGEGWGLSFSEAAACRIPIIAPYSTSFMEMSDYGRNAYMLYNLSPICQTADNAVRKQINIYELADRIREVAIDKYKFDSGIQNKINRSYEWAINLDWKEVCKDWTKYFKETY